jgi:hypothetical protein
MSIRLYFFLVPLLWTPQVRVPGPGGEGSISIGQPALKQAICSAGTSSAVNMTGTNFFVGSVVGGGGTGLPGDSSGNTWASLTGGGSGNYTQLFYVQNPTVTAAQTFNPGSTGGTTFCVLAFSNMATSGVYEAGTVNNNFTASGGTTATPGSTTPLSSVNVIVTAIGNSSSGVAASSIGSGFTLPAAAIYPGNSNWGNAIAYSIQTGTASQNPIWTMNGIALYGWQATIASFVGQ